MNVNVILIKEPKENQNLLVQGCQNTNAFYVTLSIAKNIIVNLFVVKEMIV